MSTKMRSVLSVLLCLSGVALCEQLVVNQRCQEHCTETYPEHTYPHVSYLLCRSEEKTNNLVSNTMGVFLIA